MKIFTALCLVLMLTLSGCGRYVMHPGAVSVAESKTYDIVNDANSVINFSRPLLASGQLPARLKPAFDTLVDAFNVAYEALALYDNAVHAGLAADAKLTKLNAAKVSLVSALAAFKGAR